MGVRSGRHAAVAGLAARGGAWWTCTPQVGTKHPRQAVVRGAFEEPPLAELMAQVADRWAYITWTEIASVIQRQAAAFHHLDDPSVRASIVRTARCVNRAISWHT
jgi:hypothetical protein